MKWYILVSFFVPLLYAQETDVELSQELVSVSQEEPDSGNWYEKLMWWKKAKQLYTEDIKDAMDQLGTIEKQYQEKKKVILEPLTKSIHALPASKAQAVPLIDKALADITKQLEAVGVAQEEKARLEGREKTLEALKKDYENLATLKQRLDEVFNRVYSQQIQEAQRYEEKALEHYEKIGQVLNDKKAHKYYLMVENSLENIRSLSTYLTGPLASFVDKTAAMLNQIIARIPKLMQELENEGILIRILSEEEKAQQQAQLEAKRKMEAEKKAQAERQARSWWQRWFSTLGSFFSSIWQSITGFFGRFFGAKPLPKA